MSSGTRTASSVSLTPRTSACHSPGKRSVSALTSSLPVDRGAGEGAELRATPRRLVADAADDLRGPALAVQRAA